MAQIFANAPLWIWPLFVALLALGLRARHARKVPVVLIYALPLLVVLPLRTLAGLGPQVGLWVAFALAFAAGAVAGHKLQRRWLLGLEGRRVHLAGENLTLVVLMVIFWANFTGGFMQAVVPALYDNALFQLSFVAVIALASGSFSGRALGTYLFVRAGP